jgi:uncharacterized protein YndB with AHSA1/START domain
MTSVRRETVVPQSREEVWRALTERSVLAEWMYPNDFVPSVGHHFTFTVPANPKAGFDGTVRCEVLACTPPDELAYSWRAGGVVDTQVRFRLAPDGDGTRIELENSGFDLTHPFGEQAMRGAEHGWKLMFDKMVAALAGHDAER